MAPLHRKLITHLRFRTICPSVRHARYVSVWFQLALHLKIKTGTLALCRGVSCGRTVLLIGQLNADHRVKGEIEFDAGRFVTVSLDTCFVCRLRRPLFQHINEELTFKTGYFHFTKTNISPTQPLI